MCIYAKGCQNTGQNMIEAKIFRIIISMRDFIIRNKRKSIDCWNLVFFVYSINFSTSCPSPPKKKNSLHSIGGTNSIQEILVNMQSTSVKTEDSLRIIDTLDRSVVKKDNLHL